MSMIMFLESVAADAAVERHEVMAADSLSPWGPGMLVGALEDDDDSICLEKAWHGLHYLLTEDAYGGTGYGAFLLCGGADQGEDMGYGPARIFTAKDVVEINKALSAITADELWSRFDPEAMADADVYGADWIEEREEELREEYTLYFEMLQQFVSATAESGNAMRISMA